MPPTDEARIGVSYGSISACLFRRSNPPPGTAVVVAYAVSAGK